MKDLFSQRMPGQESKPWSRLVALEFRIVTSHEVDD